MANQNQKTEQNVEQVNGQTQVNETPAQAETPVQQAPQQQVVTEKKGFGTWLKAHWKGVTAAVTGAGAAVASAVVAYKKGKAAGIMSVPAPQQDAEDYSLNPNE